MSEGITAVSLVDLMRKLAKSWLADCAGNRFADRPYLSGCDPVIY